MNAPKTAADAGGSSTYHGRIRIACAANMITTAAQFQRRTNLPRTTAARHFNGEADRAEVSTLFVIADSLGYNPRWIAEGEGPPQPDIKLAPDEHELLDQYRQLSPKERAALLQWLSGHDATHHE